MNARFTLTVFVIATLAIFGFADLFAESWEMTADTTTDLGTPDSIRLSSPTANWHPDTTASYYFDISVFSDDSAAGFTFGVAFQTHFLKIDSVVFSSETLALPGPPVLYSRIDNDSTVGSTDYCGVLLGVIDFSGDPIGQVEILDLNLARVWVSINDGSSYTPQDTLTFCADTLFFPPAGLVEFATARVPTISWVPKVVESLCVYMLPLRGDFDMNGIVEISDAVALIEYVFTSGDPSDPLWIGDTDCNGIVEISDAVLLINYIFGSGPPPDCD